MTAARLSARAVLFVAFAACGGGDSGSVVDGGVGSNNGAHSGNGGDAAHGSLFDEAGNALCEAFNVDGTRVRPDMLIVLDRSSSMQSAGVDRWTPSVAGIKSITKSLDTRVDFGLMAFPGRGTGVVGTGQQCAAGTVEVAVEAAAAADISHSLDGLSLVQTTPTAASLEAARTALKASPTDVDNKRVGAKYVVLVTDGAPNCANGVAGGAVGSGTQPDPVALDATVAAITALKSDGVSTFVLGFGTKNDAVLAAALDRMAVAGGTGDTSHRAIEDEAQIVSEFQRIAGNALTCDFTLASAPDDPSYVAVSLDGKLLKLNDANGWLLSADKLRITVQGSACALLKDPAGDHAFSVQVRCSQVIVN